MAIAVSDAAAQAIALAIKEQTINQTALYTTFVAYLDLNFGQAAAVIPGSPAMAQRVQVQVLNDIHVVLTNMLDQQQKMKSSIDTLQSGLASVSSQLAAGVTTTQLATADQIKANKFQQQTTNASLKRADLPETEVSDESFLSSTQKLVDDTLTFKSQIGISSLVEGQISSAIGWTATTVGNMVSNSFIGSGARTALGTVKGWLKITETKLAVVKTTTEQTAAARGALLLDAKPPLPVEGSATDTP